MRSLLLAASLLAALACHADDLRATAAAKLARGGLQKWERAAYEKIMAGKHSPVRRAKVTTYCPRCSGGTCADGSPVRRGICAASPNIPMHSILWVEGDGILQVCDRGGLVKVGTVTWRGRRVTCTRKGESANLDVWVPSCAGGCWTGPGTRRLVRYVVVN